MQIDPLWISAVFGPLIVACLIGVFSLIFSTRKLLNSHMLSTEKERSTGERKLREELSTITACVAKLVTVVDERRPVVDDHGRRLVAVETAQNTLQLEIVTQIAALRAEGHKEHIEAREHLERLADNLRAELGHRGGVQP